MSTHVAGFLFSPKLKRVALVKKAKPKWQAGLCNAIGGSIDPTDSSPLAAQIREFNEETGVYIDDWKHFCSLTSARDTVIEFFTTKSPLVDLCRTMEDKGEEILVLTREQLVNHEIPLVPNLLWLYEMAITVHEARDICTSFKTTEIY